MGSDGSGWKNGTMEWWNGEGMMVGLRGVFYPLGRQRCELSSSYKSSTR